MRHCCLGRCHESPFIVYRAAAGSLRKENVLIHFSTFHPVHIPKTCLYRRLLSHGLTAFLDQEELQTGRNFDSQIKEAIRTASVHIAKSEWCLKELVLMLESGAPIIPVFHQVKPDEVRHTRGEGKYGRALQKLEEKRTRDSQPRYDTSTIEKWRNTLSRVADISGLDVAACMPCSSAACLSPGFLSRHTHISLLVLKVIPTHQNP